MDRKRPRNSPTGTTRKLGSGKGFVSLLVSHYWYFLLPLCAFILFSNTLHIGFPGDDPAVIKNHRFVQEGIKGTGKIFTHGFYDAYEYKDPAYNDPLYRPVVLLSFAIGKTLWDNNPVIEHGINILLYAVCGILLFYFLNLTGATPSPVTAGVVVLLFLVHPVHTEAVASIKNRDELLCLIFMLGTLVSLVQFIKTEKRTFLFATFLSFVLCLLSKEMGITLLALMPLTIFYVQQDFKISRWLVLLIPAVVLAALYLAVKFLVCGSLINPSLHFMDNSLLAAQSWADMLATNFLILLKYLCMLVFPYRLGWDYAYHQIPTVSWLHPLPMLSLLIHVALLAYAFAGLRKKHFIAYGLLFYFITLSVVSNLFVKISSTMADRFLFAPSAGFILAAVLTTALLLGKIADKQIRSALSSSLTVIVIGLLAYKTYAQNNIWADPFSIAQNGVKVSPNSARAHLFLGHEYISRSGQTRDRIQQVQLIKKGIACYQRSLTIYPQYSGALNSLGRVYHSLGMPDSALYYFRQVPPGDREYPLACYGMGDAWYSLGQKDSALYYFMKIPEDEVVFGLAANSIGFMYSQMNRPDEALRYLKKVRPENPSYGKASMNIGKLFINEGLPDSALHYFLKVPPDDAAFASARVEAARVLIDQKKYAEAIEVLEKVGRNQGAVPYRNALYFSGRAFYEMGDLQSALYYFHNATLIDPGFRPAYEAMAQTYKAAGDEEKAAYYTRLAQTKPEPTN
ncbi:MAG: hypothetical protein KatS3mg031_1050 [Chitinophagales bacterium]|nr:MAG: hypothetical protein KatS3mg031_1050 [Chitinophagales bacterium]